MGVRQHLECLKTRQQGSGNRGYHDCRHTSHGWRVQVSATVRCWVQDEREIHSSNDMKSRTCSAGLMLWHWDTAFLHSKRGSLPDVLHQQAAWYGCGCRISAVVGYSCSLFTWCRAVVPARLHLSLKHQQAVLGC